MQLSDDMHEKLLLDWAHNVGYNETCSKCKQKVTEHSEGRLCPARKVKLHEIAKELGLSLSVVSNVLHGRGQSLRIIQAAEKRLNS